MKRPILRASVLVGALALGMTGCHQTGETTKSASKPKPVDPSSWSEKDLTRDDSGSASSSLPRSSSRTGTWSNEARDVERSLGIQ